jgi:hypothetical protein
VKPVLQKTGVLTASGGNSMARVNFLTTVQLFSKLITSLKRKLAYQKISENLFSD